MEEVVWMGFADVRQDARVITVKNAIYALWRLVLTMASVCSSLSSAVNARLVSREPVAMF
jgi:NADH:ubiquinone oxidoreductase subunit 6 (subunit J)